MAETLRGVFGKISATDINWGDSTGTFSQSRMAIAGGSTTTTPAYVDSAVIPLSTASKTLLSLVGTQYLDAAFTALSTGAGLQYATTSQNGQIYRMSAAPASAGQPIAMEQNDPRIGYIPTAAQKNALANSAQTPDYGNPFVTRYEMQLALSLNLGSGKDGHGKLGAIAASSTAPASLDVATAGLLTGTYTYKIAAYNLSGTIVASSASASTGAISAKQVTMTLPALPSGAMGWRIYRSTDGANWYYVGSAVKGFNYTETANDARRYLYTDNAPYPNTSVSAPGSDTTGHNATLSGLLQFITFTTVASDAITVASSGNTAGFLDIRVQGTWTGADAAWTITGTGANTVVNRFRSFANATGSGYGSPGMFVALLANEATFTTSGASGYSTSTLSAPLGLGADASYIGRLLSGFGTYNGGTGGYGGAFVRIWCYTTATATIGGTITVSGAAGTNSGVDGGGGGGGAGGLIDIGCVLPWKDTGTRTAAGGAGGNGFSTGRGGGGGGGGAVVRRNCFDKTSATTSVAGGATGTNANTAIIGGAGGAHYGNGGVNGPTFVTVATAGQQFDFNGLFDPSPIFAA